MPALPLDEAGKYVAAAYIVFVALILVYVAIMATKLAGIRPTALAEAIYSARNCDAARHLFRVACGLESMIVGENEVQGQVKRAYEAALDAGVTGPLSNRVFSAALATGKRARTETGIS